MWKSQFYVAFIIILQLSSSGATQLGLLQSCIVQPDSCKPLYTCDPVEKICRCSEGTTQDQWSFTCVGLVGRNCSMEHKLCVSNANCDEEFNICKCYKGYVPSEDFKTCRKKIYSESCQDGRECGSNFECLNGTCNCGTRNPVLRQDSSGCRKKVNGEACQKKEDCIHETLDCLNGTCACPSGKAYVDNEYELLGYGRRAYPEHFKVPDSICVSKVGRSCYFGPSKERKPCVRNTHCTGHEICECADGFHAEEDGHCYPKHGTDCRDVQCREGLHCYEGKCACPNQDYEVYDQEICQRVPGASCNSSQNHCIEDAFCNAEGKCECLEGFSQLDNFKCGKLLSHEEFCEYGDKTAKCDERQGLACIERVCQCKNRADSYDLQKRRCVRSEGYPCRGMGECETGSRCDQSRFDPAGICKNHIPVPVPTFVFSDADDVAPSVEVV